MKSFSVLAALLASTASAHTIFQQIGVNGVMQERYKYLRLPDYNGPIEDVTSSAVTCNGGPNPITRVSSEVKDIKAGDEITLQWAHHLNSELGTGLAIDASHKGPVLVYLAKVDDATGPVPTSGWFKIYEDGYNNGVWGVDKLIANAGKVTVTIPSCIAPGEYLLRGELIALHSASSYPGAQLYMECAQVRITAGGSATPATYNIPGIYSGTDAGIKFNLYQGFTSYTIPGPAVFTCSGSSTPTTLVTSSRVPATTSAAASTSASATPSAVPGGTLARYAQCGGQGWTGTGTCVSGATCTVINPYYHQCL